MTDTRDAAASMSANATFRGGAVVQLLDGPGGSVVRLADATVSVRADRVVADADDGTWTWLGGDIEEAVHGLDDGWTLFRVLGVPDHGVAVMPDDVPRFRAALRALLGDDPPAAADEMDDLVDAVIEPVTEPVVDPVIDPVIDLRIAPRPEGSATGPVPGLATLEARSISAWFGTHHVLDRVSLTMPAGHVTALIGPSGCGKSTFIRILNRMHEMIPSAALAGEVLLDGADIYDPSRKLTDARRQIGMVFQKPNPFPAMSIYDNVLASFRLTGTKLSASEKDEVVQTCLAKAGLWDEVRDRLGKPGGSLSGGQQQRLCIARALAIKPRVLLMDEPCSALDPTSTRRIEQTIVELRTDVTIVIVTHNMQQAARVSDQCAFFLAEAGTPGAIVEYGDTAAMFNTPQDERTNAYVNGRFG